MYLCKRINKFDMKEIIEALPFDDGIKIIVAVVLLVIIVCGIIYKKYMRNST
jgi:hypothetical protein